MSNNLNAAKNSIPARTRKTSFNDFSADQTSLLSSSPPQSMMMRPKLSHATVGTGGGGAGASGAATTATAPNGGHGHGGSVASMTTATTATTTAASTRQRRSSGSNGAAAAGGGGWRDLASSQSAEHGSPERPRDGMRSRMVERVVLMTSTPHHTTPRKVVASHSLTPAAFLHPDVLRLNTQDLLGRVLRYRSQGSVLTRGTLLKRDHFSRGNSMTTLHAYHITHHTTCMSPPPLPRRQGQYGNALGGSAQLSNVRSQCVRSVATDHHRSHHRAHHAAMSPQRSALQSLFRILVQHP